MWVWSKRSAVSREEVWEERFYGNQNFVITRLRSGKFLRVDLYCKREGDALKLMGQFGGVVRNLKEVDWVAESARPVPPVKIRDSLLVTSETNTVRLRELQESRGDRALVIIPAEMAFGTGDHVTTSSCLRFLADEARSRQSRCWSMLDVGCGTGVLAIAASLLGAAGCEAMDIDPKAVSVARCNVERNKADGVEVLQSDLDDWTPGRSYDVIMANLFATVLQRSFVKMADALAVGGSLILSGVLQDQWDETKEVAQAAGLTFDVVQKRGKWIAAKGGLA